MRRPYSAWTDIPGKRAQAAARLVDLVASRDIETIKTLAATNYPGTVLSDEYARDLIAFVDALTQEDS